MEDDPATYLALRAILERRGHPVSLATTLGRALELLVTQRPAIVILDLMLPDGDGIRLLEMAKRDGHDAKVVVTTGSNDPARLKAVEALGPTVLLKKPVELGELLKAMG